MPDRGGKSASRKAARALPLTHRQHKSKKQPQTQAGAKVTASSPRKTASRVRTTRASTSAASSIVELVDDHQPEPSLTAPAISDASAGAEHLEALSQMDTTLLAPLAEDVSEPVAVAEPVATLEQPERAEASEPVRQMVRVRRKRPVVEPIKPDYTREDTVPLIALSDAPATETKLIVVASSGPFAMPVEAASAIESGEPRDSAPAAPAAPPQDEAVESTTVLDATTVLEPTKTLTSAAAGMDATTILEPTKRLEPVTTPRPLENEGATSILAPTTILNPSVADATADSAEPEPQAEHMVTPAPKHPRMPTLAVMAALAPRPEADPPAASIPSAPSVPEIEDVFAADVEPARAPAANALVEQPPIAVEAPAGSPSGGASAAGEAQRERHHGIQGMWWPLAAMRRSAPDTRPVVPSLASLDTEIETTAPHASARRRASTAADGEPTGGATSQSSKRNSAPRGSSFTFDLPDIDESGAFYDLAPHVRQYGPRRPQLALVLTWTSGAHAGVASVAALVAVIAALRSGTVAGALTVFVWALTITLIAGIGAAIGYICLQVARPKLATLALLMSQLAIFMWALALIGPRAALLALAPASAALALRGIGRASAVGTAFAWMAVFIVDEVYTLAGGMTAALSLNAVAGALTDIALPLVGLWLVVNILVTLHTSRMQVLAHGRALEHAILLSEAELSRLRTQMEDDAEALRRALLDASHGEQPERVYARGALSAVADAVNDIADRLIDLRYDRAERKRLEGAIRRLTRVIERAWLGLSWSWPDATGTILDDLLALLRTPPPPDAPALLDETAPTGQVVAPHLFRGWQPIEQRRTAEQTGTPQPKPETAPRILPSQPSQPSMPSLWPSNPGAGLIESLELPPYPKWRSPNSRPAGWSEVSDG
ncbi:MAG TPA: hypothetical protein VF792_13300 [Ktedonobacterales bacterium]